MTTLLEVINKCYPNERGDVEVSLSALRGGDYMTDRTTYLADVIATLRKHDCQVNISFHANGQNPIFIAFEKYVISLPNHKYGWGHQYEALIELCSKYIVNFWDDEDFGYELNIDGSLARA